MNLFGRGAAILLLIFLAGMATAVTPSFQHYFPTSDPTDSVGTARTFTIIMNQSVTNASWYVNGTLKQSNTSGYTLTYTNSTSGIGYWNITVVVTGNDANSSNATSRMWNWTVLALDQPSITGYAPASDPTDLNTSSRTFNITVNQTGTIAWYINGSLLQTTSSATESSYTNSTADSGYYNVTVIFTGTNGTTSRMWNWTRTIAPTITSYAPTSLTPSDTYAVISRTFNVTADRSSNYTWYVDGTLVQTNTTTETISNYTNNSATLGTHNVSVIANNTNGTGNMITWSWNIPSSTISGIGLVTNHSTAGRVIMGTNSSLNFSWTDTGNITTVNLTFPTTFKFSSLLSANVSSNLGTMTVTLDESTGLISLYNATGLNNSVIYVNFTVNVTTPATASDYSIQLTTNKKATNTTFKLYARDTTKPYFVVANNSVFTVGTETFGTLTTTIPLTGTGVANLTFYAPNITSQTNITVGWGATNISKLQVNRSNNQTIIYLTTLGTVANPIIVLSAPNEMEASNLPAAVIAGGIITGATIIYLFRRRRH